ncbi:hypothetical protein Baya_11001 [Bagarius yarrelli]|uniref:Uncharacterized protein n=1 Tax=Bagarius yarrelli TaxID=175774 RepID=A0A556UYM1_BAGYA|nr:hypothetical protein Baya_11001 [Bagarius yarrelli]
MRMMRMRRREEEENEEDKKEEDKKQEKVEENEEEDKEEEVEEEEEACWVAECRQLEEELMGTISEGRKQAVTAGHQEARGHLLGELRGRRRLYSHPISNQHPDILKTSSFTSSPVMQRCCGEEVQQQLLWVSPQNSGLASFLNGGKWLSAQIMHKQLFCPTKQPAFKSEDTDVEGGPSGCQSLSKPAFIHADYIHTFVTHLLLTVTQSDITVKTLSK